MIPVIDPWVWVLVALILQPLIIIAWLFLAYRIAVSFTAAKVRTTIDGRVDNAVEQLTGDE